MVIDLLCYLFWGAVTLGAIIGHWKLAIGVVVALMVYGEVTR